ncbi:Na+/H+ antiporter NhaC family protein, partial [Staphylococcus epidermidis]|nr:Na+/H+ antiporter NhaC family protein [Staphylococcus epidermidis]
MEEGNKGHAWALLPLVLFIALFLGIGIATGDFSNMPLNVAITITVIVALMMNRKEKFSKKIEIFTQGAGHS